MFLNSTPLPPPPNQHIYWVVWCCERKYWIVVYLYWAWCYLHSHRNSIIDWWWNSSSDQGWVQIRIWIQKCCACAFAFEITKGHVFGFDRLSVFEKYLQITMKMTNKRQRIASHCLTGSSSRQNGFYTCGKFNSEQADLWNLTDSEAAGHRLAAMNEREASEWGLSPPKARTRNVLQIILLSPAVYTSWVSTKEARFPQMQGYNYWLVGTLVKIRAD